MKRLATTLALAFALSTFAPAALAEEFRTAEPQAFSRQELQQYGLSEADASQVAAYQADGYQVVVMSPEEAAQYQAGVTDNQWIWLGILAGVIVIAVAVSD